jgi:hypothetical protein
MYTADCRYSCIHSVSKSRSNVRLRDTIRRTADEVEISHQLIIHMEIRVFYLLGIVRLW